MSLSPPKADLLDRESAQGMSTTALAAPRVLYVAWQDPETRRFRPVGRLLAREDSTRPRFEFAYINGARDAVDEGFRPFPNFPELGEAYHSDDLFPFFANRVMDRERPDFARHVGYFRLDPESADPIELLARGGGPRATDSLVVFPIPRYDPVLSCYLTYFLAHGIRHLDPSAHERVLRLAPEERLIAWPDPDNPADPDAMRLWTTDEVSVGFLPRYLTKEAQCLWELCSYLEIHVESVNPPPAPIQQRLLCRMESCWPENFRPFDDPAFQPISDQAAELTPMDYGVFD